MNSLSQAERIQQAILKSVQSRDQYAEKQVKQMLKTLKQAETGVKAELLRIKEKSIISKGLEIRQTQLEGIQKEIDIISRELRKEMSLIARRSMMGAYRKSFEDVVNEWGEIGAPSYSGLSQVEKVKLVVDVFSLVDRSALDFLVNYESQLLGNVSRELAEGIKNQITIGLIQGESTAKISQNIGGIITNPEEFRRTGKTVFKTAQLRTETIVRSETLRAYNQGRNKFYSEVGVTYVVWLAVGDKRSCPECQELEGKRFKVGEAPGPPRHSNCRCVTFADQGNLWIKEKPPAEKKEKELVIATAAKDTPTIVIISPEEIAEKARKKRSEKQQIGRWIKAGEFENLNLSQLQVLAKKWGVSIYRTKEDFIPLLAPLESKVDWDNIKGVKLKKLLLKHKISAMKSNEELVQALKNKQKIKIFEKL
jgi:SPP1 gp7 family putative phage head morphogenesis protein